MYGNKREKGSAIFFTIIVLAIILGVAFGLSTIIFGGLDILKRSGNSTIAFYAAEAGIENILFADLVNDCVGDVDCLNANNPGTIVLSNGASYIITVEEDGVGTCPAAAAAYCAQSAGSFQEATRKIEIER